ncbi:putative l-aminoadipate-semialdehyde dehydrogenase large subunit protein [Eutypa lata UCREL1]|uniref:Putative l-aminoadipate-semialdehyde dehydrogenase large subunit protein n=1 Tax=Eutypa lata (strain UCR-EL1) TaxID=1287681 RepID=M7SDX2_EUTLA|nr:putative l-aminoadipate-semialdehyde dehydrogenase large subunit protein [Eutypa lata UCREL1]
MVTDNLTVARKEGFSSYLVICIMLDMQKCSVWLEQNGKQDDTSRERILGRIRRFWSLTEEIKKYFKNKLPSYVIPEREPPSPSSEIMALLMDATGFLGAFLLQDLLVRQKHQVKQVIMHAWAKNEAETLNRVQRTSTAYGI